MYDRTLYKHFPCNYASMIPSFFGLANCLLASVILGDPFSYIYCSTFLTNETVWATNPLFPEKEEYLTNFKGYVWSIMQENKMGDNQNMS